LDRFGQFATPSATPATYDKGLWPLAFEVQAFQVVGTEEVCWVEEIDDHIEARAVDARESQGELALRRLYPRLRRNASIKFALERKQRQRPRRSRSLRSRERRLPSSIALASARHAAARSHTKAPRAYSRT